MIVKKNEAKDITQLLKELFKTHGLESEEHEGWIIPQGNDYAMKGYWYPEATESTGQLSIEVFIDSEMIMVESFAGLGESGEERLKSALSGFIHHSFSTFLQAIWGIKSNDVRLEEWNIGKEKYTAYTGKQGILNYDREKSLEIPKSYTSKVQGLIVTESLEKKFHWFNVFYANLNGLDTYAEILKDNVRWNEGEKLLKSMAWKGSNHYYAVRQFVVLVRV